MYIYIILTHCSKLNSLKHDVQDIHKKHDQCSHTKHYQLQIVFEHLLTVHIIIDQSSLTIYKLSNCEYKSAENVLWEYYNSLKDIFQF